MLHLILKHILKNSECLLKNRNDFSRNTKGGLFHLHWHSYQKHKMLLKTYSIFRAVRRHKKKLKIESYIIGNRTFLRCNFVAASFIAGHFGVDYFVAKQFRRRRHQIFRKIFFIFHILLFCLKNLFSIFTLFLCQYITFS